MGGIRGYVKLWFAEREAERRVIDGTATDHEVLGALTGLPPEAFAFIEECQTADLLVAKLSRWWRSIPQADRPVYVTMRQLQAMFGGEGVGAWQIGNALRRLGWNSSRRSWKEKAPRSRAWVPPPEVIPVPK